MITGLILISIALLIWPLSILLVQKEERRLKIQEYVVISVYRKRS